MKKILQIIIIINGLIFVLYIFSYNVGQESLNHIKNNLQLKVLNEDTQNQETQSNQNKLTETKYIASSNKINVETEEIILSSCNNRVIRKNIKSIWTYLTDGDGYHRSAIKLIKSIKNHTTVHDYDTLILEIKEKPLSQSIKQSLISNGWQICQVDRIAPRDEENTFGRFRDQFTKLVLWNFIEYEAIYYFDSDTFVIGNIDSFLNTHENFNSSIKIGVTRDISASVWKSTFNMGVFVIKPNKEEFVRLIKLKNDPNFLFETAMSEQGFLNVAYKDQWYEIGFENNANLAVYSQKPEYWKERESKINVIHYTMNKPWQCGNEYKAVCQLWQESGY
jgi:alpha-N-acetylglucosamine transferase